MRLTTVITIVLVFAAVRYMNGGKRGQPAYTPEGMRVLYNPRLGNVAFIIMAVIGAFMLFFGVLCFQDIGFGQGGVVFLFLLVGAGAVGLGFLFKKLSDGNRICFDDRRVIRQWGTGSRVEMEWWEVVEYSCDPRKTFLIAADGRRINVDFTYDGFEDLVQMIQEKVVNQGSAQR